MIGIGATLTGDAKKYYSWVSEPEEELPALVPESAYGASGGLSGLLDGGINFVIDHIHPLLEMLDYVTGDSEALEAAAAAWHDQGTALNNVIRELKTSASGLPSKWGGQTCNQFGQFMGDVTTSLTELVSVMGQTQQILDDAREQSEFAHDTIVMIIREVIEWFAGNAAIDLATMGAATIFEAAGTSIMLANKIRDAEEAESKLAGVYKALKKIVDSLQDAKKAYSAAKGLGKLKALNAMPKAFGEAFEAGTLKNLRFFSNGKVADAAKAVFGAGRHAKGVPEVLELGTAGVLTTVGVRVGVSGAMAATGIESDPGLTAWARA